jgi:cryptochrome
MKKYDVAVHWFRKGLRLHDNPSLLDAINNALTVYPIIILDPWFANPSIIGVNRYIFFLQSLSDLDESLKKLGSQLFIVNGRPEDIFPAIFENFGAKYLTFESDYEPYAIIRDKKIGAIALQFGVDVSQHESHTLHSNAAYDLHCNQNNYPKTYSSFLKMFSSIGIPRLPLDAPTNVNNFVILMTCCIS